MTDLRPNKTLLNHQFNGYKLASTKLENITLPLAVAVNEPSQITNQYSYIYTRCRGMHNHLYVDEWNRTVYYVDLDYRITTLLHSDDGTPSVLYQVSTIPPKERKFAILSCTLLFPCETLAVLCDGGGSVYLIHTGHRKKDQFQKWKSDGEPLYDFDRPTHVLHGNIEKDILHVLALTLEERKGDGMYCVFYWLQIKVNFENPSESLVKGMKRFMSKDLPNALWLSRDYTHLLVAASKRFHLVNEDLERIEPPKLDNGHSADKIPVYEWTQTKELVTISFLLCLTENEIECEIKYNQISVKLKNGKSLLEGNLEKEIVRDASRWYVEKNKLEVVLVKKVGGEFWDTIVPSDTYGSHVIEGEEAARIQEIGESLSHLTSENENQKTSDQAQMFNMAQLEDCDEYGEEEVKLYSIDVFTGEVVTQKNFAGHHWLFSKSSNSTSSPVICLRHDVDGIVWQPDDLDQWEHKATFDAFGYVHASKKDSKYTLCTPNFKFAFVTDCTSHLYVYDSDQANPSQHNQYVSRFTDSNKILGCQATNTHLYILTDKDLNILTLP